MEKLVRTVVPITVAVLVLNLTGTLRRTPRTGHEPAPRSRGATSWLPPAVGNEWNYTMTRAPGGERLEFKLKIVKRRTDGSYVFVESVGGRMQSNYTARWTERGLVMREYSVGRSTILFLPRELEEGVSWNLKRYWRASVVDAGETEEAAPPGGREGSSGRRTVKVEYETYYPPGMTKHPGWYFDGYRWFERGVGMIKEDLSACEYPPDMSSSVKERGTVKILKDYKVRNERSSGDR